MRADLATKTELREEIQSVKTELRGESQSFKTELRGESQSVKTELREEITGLGRQIVRVAAELVNTQADVRRIEQSMATKKDVERILGAIDSFAKQTFARQFHLISFL